MNLFLLFLLFSCAHATVYLTSDTFEEQTQGKKSLVAFKAPWCGHCKKLKPDWDKLSESVDVLIGEVDCTKEQKLCQQHGVQGYPTIKYSDGFGWKKYERARDYASLESFVSETLEDTCFDDPKLCSEEELQKIEEVKALSAEEVITKLNELQDELDLVESTFKTRVEELQKTYKQLSDDKMRDVESLSKQKAYLQYVQARKDEL